MTDNRLGVALLLLCAVLTALVLAPANIPLSYAI